MRDILLRRILQTGMPMTAELVNRSGNWRGFRSARWRTNVHIRMGCQPANPVFLRTSKLLSIVQDLLIFFC